jgi:hypothetical protein
VSGYQGLLVTNWSRNCWLKTCFRSTLLKNQDSFKAHFSRFQSQLQYQSPNNSIKAGCFALPGAARDANWDANWDANNDAGSGYLLFRSIGTPLDTARCRNGWRAPTGWQKG